MPMQNILHVRSIESAKMCKPKFQISKGGKFFIKVQHILAHIILIGHVEEQYDSITIYKCISKDKRII